MQKITSWMNSGPAAALMRGITKASATAAGSLGRAVRPSTARMFIAITVVGAAGGTALATGATATSRTLKVEGSLVNRGFTGPNCPSPVPQCYEGEFRGSLKGPVLEIVQSLAPSSRSDVLYGDATLKIRTKHGNLNCRELFVYNISPTSDGHFSWLCEITDGTGRYAGATGYLQGAGTAPPSANVATSTYNGVITLR